MSTRDYGFLNSMEDYDSWRYEFECLMNDACLGKLAEKRGCSMYDGIRQEVEAAARGFSKMIKTLLERSRGNSDDAKDLRCIPSYVMVQLVESWCLSERLKWDRKGGEPGVSVRPGNTTIPCDVADAMRYCYENKECVSGMSISLWRLLTYLYEPQYRANWPIDPWWTTLGEVAT